MTAAYPPLGKTLPLPDLIGQLNRHLKGLANYYRLGHPRVVLWYLFLVYRSFEKTTHQRPNPIHFFFQREMARVEKMELCAGNISFKEFSTLHREDSIVFAPRDQRRGLMFTEVLLPIVENIQISLRVVED